MNSKKIVLILLVVFSTLFQNVFTSFAQKKDVLLNGNSFIITKNKNIYTVYDKNIKRSFQMILSGNVVTQINFDDGESRRIKRDLPIKNSIILDSCSIITKGTPVPKGVHPEKLKYHYYKTRYTNTQEINNYKSFWYSLLGYVPIVGQIVSFVGFLDSVKSINKSKVVFFKIKQYYANGYLYYKYVTYAYKDSARKKFIKKHTDYVKMW